MSETTPKPIEIPVQIAEVPIATEASKPSRFQKMFQNQPEKFNFITPVYACAESTPDLKFQYGAANCYTKKALRIARWAAGAVLLICAFIFIFSYIIEIDWKITGYSIIVGAISFALWFILILSDGLIKERNAWKVTLIVAAVVGGIWLTIWLIFNV